MGYFHINENFKCLTDGGVPYSMAVERNSSYEHNHLRSEDGVFYISCSGNKYLFKTPDLHNVDVRFRFGFHYSGATAACGILLGYDRKTRKGFSLRMNFSDGKNAEISLVALDALEEKVIGSFDLGVKLAPEEDDGFGKRKTVEYCLDFSLEDNAISGSLCDIDFGFDLPYNCNEKGSVGMEFMHSLGEMFVSEFDVESDDDIESNVLIDKTTVEIPLRNGGNMPYTFTYSVEERGSVKYLDWCLDGGAQYRENYKGYPRDTMQYSVEVDKITSPFVSLYGKNDTMPFFSAKLFDGQFATADPGLHWQSILFHAFGIIKLPLTGTLPIEDCGDIDRIAFGYAMHSTRGYALQEEQNVEFIYSKDGVLLSEGKKKGVEHIDIESPADKLAVTMIPEYAHDKEALRRHFVTNHYFAESENITFTAKIEVKNARFATVEAICLDVFNDEIGKFGVKKVSENEYKLNFKPLKCGVYKVRVDVLFGGKVGLSRTVTFEVFDVTHKYCAPIESGLPVLYSMPNEQKYLDRDAFDPWNPFPSCDLEHYYSMCAFTGDIAVKKRTWEMTSFFARDWFVWLNDHRTLTSREFKNYDEIISKTCDYAYYPIEYEWAVMRHDYFRTFGYEKSGLMNYLYDFIDLHPEYEIDIPKGQSFITQEQLDGLLLKCATEWITYANKRTLEALRRDNEILKQKGKNFKRSCYGPCPLYVIPMGTHSVIRWYGFTPEPLLAHDVFSGFCQLEDYPISCAYHSYRGSFMVMNLLLHVPDLCIYPEQYKSSMGGCIDGAVKDATPPLGKYNVPTTFNVVHAYEYVYNTAHLTETGFKFWDKYGFMQREFSFDYVDEFVKGWKNVVLHKPAKPHKSAAYLSEIPDTDDRYQLLGGMADLLNISDAGICYVYETTRLCGLPSGFAVDRTSLMMLDSDNTDTLILPSLTGASKVALSKIRLLHESGVPLVAVGTVGGLEDIFGVKENRKIEEINVLRTENGNEEAILPSPAEFFYDVDGADVILWAENSKTGEKFPAIIKNGNAVLINAPVPELGRSSYRQSASPYKENNSVLFRKVVSDIMRELSSSEVYSDNCGISYFKDVEGNDIVLAIDYSPYDYPHINGKEEESTITLPYGKYKEAELLYGREITSLTENGVLGGIGVKLRYQECSLIKLIPNEKEK